VSTSVPSGGGGSVAAVTALESLDLELEQAWEELAAATGASPFCRPGWIKPWWTSFGAGRLELATVRRGGRLDALLPLRRRLGSLTSPTNWHTPAFNPVARDAADLRILAQAVFQKRPHWFSLAFLDADSESRPLLREAAREHGFRVLERTLERSPYLAVDRPWHEYESSLSRNVRGDAKRRIRRLEELGSLSLDVNEGNERLDDLLTEGFGVEASGWKGASRSAIASRMETEALYRSVAEWAAHQGWLRLAFLRLDGAAIAFHYSLEHEGNHYFVKGGHDPRYSSLSPGKVLTYWMLSRAFSLGLASYEFLGGDDPWKLRWTSTVRERSLFHAFRPGPVGLAEWMLFNYGRRVARRAAHTRPVAYLRRGR
jgi:CelD/BcsL family acetyltransferase involved in cellulose biosynthesis